MNLEDRAAAVARAQWGPLPVKTGLKAPVPVGFNGADDPLPSYADWHAWIEQNPGAYENLGVRIPDGVVILDVDSYKGKGAWSRLMGSNWPPTVRISARGFDDGLGHWLYRVPPDRDPHSLPSGVGDIDVLRSWHRYTMAPGSWNPDAAAQYEAMDMRSGEVLHVMPPVYELPEMPTWLWDAMVADSTTVRPGSSDTPLVAATGDACAMVASVRMPTWTEGGRYDAMVHLQYHLVGLECEGHSGVEQALEALRESYLEELAQNPRGRGGAEPGMEFDRALAGARAKREAEGYTDECRCHLDPLEVGGQAFWQTRPWMTELYAFAKGRMVQPWAVLAATMVRLACEVPPTVVLPPVIGGKKSLNLYVALVGGPSAGKSAAKGVSDACGDLLSRMGGWTSDEVKPGSGEGLIKSFAYPVNETNPETGHKEWRLKWVTNRVVMSSEEISVLESLTDRAGATMAPILREAWDGSSIGFGYADMAKRVQLPAHSYRLGVIVGAQPGKADFLTRDHEAGTPQRYLWIQAEDRTADDNAPEAHLTASIILPFEIFEPREVQVVLPDWLRSEVRRRRAEQSRGEIEIRQHEDMNRLKLAALFAFTEGRIEVNAEDWWLAEVMIRHSHLMFDWMTTYQKDKARAANRARGEADAERQDSASEHRLAKQALAAARVVHRHSLNPPTGKRPHGEHCSITCLRNAVRAPAGENRQSYAKAAIAMAVERGWVVERVLTSHEAVARPRAFYLPGTLP